MLTLLAQLSDFDRLYCSLCRWLSKADHEILREDRQELFRLFRGTMYAKTEGEFKVCQLKLESSDVAAKYPQYLTHLKKSYGHRIETLAQYIRTDRGWPTRGSNTNNYCETSMKTTKETQFGRVRTFNLPELLQVICDDSAYYRNHYFTFLFPTF